MTSDPGFVPAVASFAFEGELDGETAEGALRIFSDALSQATLECVRRGAAAIGHDKMNVEAGGGMLSLSCTTEDGRVRSRGGLPAPVRGYRGALNVIVYGISSEDAEAAAEPVLLGLPGVACVQCAGRGHACGDPRCSDPSHRHA